MKHVRPAVPAFMADSTAPRRWQEVTGARCRITGGNFHRAELVTPAPAGAAGHGAGRTGAGGGLRLGSGAGTSGSAAVYGWSNPGVPSRTNRTGGAAGDGGACS